MKENLEHQGTVIAIHRDWVDVAMRAESACASCRVKSACGMGDQTEKIVSVAVAYPASFREGERVIVSVSRRMGLKAVFLSYMLPLIMLLASLIVLTRNGVGEAVAGLASLGVLAVYYCVLRIFRNRIDREIVFEIKKTDE